ncbi:MAG: GSU2403 family nucleotidyltransferase fold protein, partial [Acidithiobacillus sp.]
MLALSRTGLFRSGVTLIGTPAYQAILHQMGVSERAAIQTNDVDLSFDRLKLGIPVHIDIEKVLKEWNSKMFAVPPLNLKHSESSLKIRGKDFHVDFLTPGLYASTGRPVHIPDIRFHAETLPFLDYLLKDSQKTLLMTRYGMMAQVPEAGRFMWHKCVTAACRPSAWEAKRKKDLMQARTLFEVLKERDPGAMRDAYLAIKNIQEPKIFMKKLQDALRLPEMTEMREWAWRNSILESARRDDENDALQAESLPNEAAKQDHLAGE